MRRTSRKLDRAFASSVVFCFLLASAPGLLGGDLFAADVLGTALSLGLLLCLIQALTLLWSIDRYDRRCDRQLEPLGRLARAESEAAAHAGQSPRTLFTEPGRNAR